MNPIRMSTNYHVIKDPVHGSMQFTDQENDWIKPFIDSINFQRLRHIKQLGLADWIFPGAVHTRFNHGLGCSYVALQIASKLKLNDEDRQTVTIAGLLHDIGHGPFSHTFEHIFRNQWIHHEDWTPLFLNDYLSPDFIKKFNQRNPSLPMTEERFSMIKSLIMHKQENKKLLADIVSSQLDADRLDYLLRDSHFCGVQYGHYDFRWLLHCLAIINHKGHDRLGITTKGVGSVEQYLMARRLMLRNVYLHAKKYAAEFHLSMFLSYLSRSVDDEKIIGALKEHNLVRFLSAVRKFNLETNENNLETHKSNFLKNNYALYKKLCDYDVFSMIRYFAGKDFDHPVVELAKRLYHRQLAKVTIIESDKLEKAKELISQIKAEPWQIRLLALPHLSYEMDKDPILVEDKNGNVSQLEQSSLMISGLSNKQENIFLLCIDRTLLGNRLVNNFLKK